MRAATAIDTVDSGAIPVPFSINTQTNATICRATKKKIVGGSSAKNSSLSLVDSLVMELNYDESYLFHGPCSFRGSFCLGLQIPFFEFLRRGPEVAEVVNGPACRRKGERFKRFLEHFVEVSPRGEAGRDVRMVILAGMFRHELRNVGD